MIISDEQARLAAQYLRVGHAPHANAPHPEVSDDLLGAVFEVLDECPDTRADRVAEAAQRLDAGQLDAHEVAEKMISRILSDSLR